MKSPTNTLGADNVQQGGKEHTYALKLFIQQVLCLVSSSESVTNPETPLLPHELRVLCVAPPHSQQEESHAQIWPFSPSSGRSLAHVNNNRPRNLGMRTQTDCLPARRSTDGEVSNLPGLRKERFPAREKACSVGANTELAQNRLTKFPHRLKRDQCSGDAQLGAPPSHSPEVGTAGVRLGRPS